jgi:hypothetical protein
MQLQVQVPTTAKGLLLGKEQTNERTNERGSQLSKEHTSQAQRIKALAACTQSFKGDLSTRSVDLQLVQAQVTWINLYVAIDPKNPLLQKRSQDTSLKPNLHNASI